MTRWSSKVNLTVQNHILIIKEALVRVWLAMLSSKINICGGFSFYFIFKYVLDSSIENRKTFSGLRKMLMPAFIYNRKRQHFLSDLKKSFSEKDETCLIS